MLQFGPKIGEIWGFYPSFVLRAPYGKPIAKVLLRLQPRHVAKFRKCQLKNVEKSASGKNLKTRKVAIIAMNCHLRLPDAIAFQTEHILCFESELQTNPMPLHF